MSVVIRLSSLGKKHQKSYRIVVSEKRSRRDGKPIDTLGFYYPLSNPPKINVEKKKIDNWVEKGAIVSMAVKKLIKE